MTLQRMIFFVGFFTVSATSSIFSTSTQGDLLAPCAFSVEADTCLPPAYTQHKTQPTRLGIPKKLPRKKISAFRKQLISMHLNRMLWLIDSITSIFSSQQLEMAEEYYAAHQKISNTITDINKSGLLNIRKTSEGMGIQVYCLTILGLNATAFPFTSFVNHVNDQLQPLYEHSDILKNLLTNVEEWGQENPQSNIKPIVAAITELIESYTDLIERLKELIEFTVSIEKFQREQEALLEKEAARHRTPQPVQLMVHGAR